MEAKTIRVKIAVAIDAQGWWHARGSGVWTEAQAMRNASNCYDLDADSARIWFVEASIPIPDSEDGEIIQAVQVEAAEQEDAK